MAPGGLLEEKRAVLVSPTSASSMIPCTQGLKSVLEEVFRCFTEVKVQIKQCKNSPIRVKFLH